MNARARLPRAAAGLLRLLLSREDYPSVSGDLTEAFEDICRNRGESYGRFWLLRQLVHTVPPIIFENLKWGGILFHNHLKTALRHLRRQKGATLINSAGLAAAMTCCLFVFLYVGFERSFDRYHQDYQRIHRVALNMKTRNGDQITAHSSPAVAPMLRERYPQVEHAVRLLGQPARSVQCGDKKFYESFIFYAEPEIFRVFTLPFLMGDPQTALEQPNTVVIARSVAERFFGENRALGQILSLNGMDYEVTGVIEDSPPNSHLRFGMLLSFREIESDESRMHFHNTNFLTYIKLAAGVDPAAFESDIRRIVHLEYEDVLKPRSTEFLLFLQPLGDIHLHSHLQGESGSPGNPLYLKIFMLVGALVLLIAGINFVNLRTARSAHRALEVGLRKVVGARRGQIGRQFLAEAMLMALLAASASLLMAAGLLGPFNALAETSFMLRHLLRPSPLGFLLIVWLLTGFAAGAYPAFVLAGFRPGSVLRGDRLRGVRGVRLRRVLVVGQFAVSITLIIATLVIFRQVDYMKNRPLGFDRARKLVIRFPRGPHMQKNYMAYKQEFLKHPDIKGATFSSTVPTRGMFMFWVWPSGEEKTGSRGMANLGMDYDFVFEYGLEIVAGRSFSRDRGEDAPGRGFLLNQEAVKLFGWSSPREALSKSLRNGLPVIGVVKNFHDQGLRAAVRPLALWINPTSFGYLTLTIDMPNRPQTLASIKRIFDGFFPGEVMQSFVLEQEFDSLYRPEERLARLLGVFSVLGIFIGCLGLIGLAAFMAERRTKEIGIRKVLGAGVGRLAALLAGEFAWWVLAANLIAWPAAGWIMTRWLGDFPYRAAFPVWALPAAAALALVIALSAVSLQSLKAASADPVDSLRYE